MYKLISRVAVVSSMLLWVFVFGAGSVNADPFNNMAFQSYLVDSGGNAINGQRALRFRIFSAASGGNLLWGETQSVEVNDGNFSVILGEGTWDSAAGDQIGFAEVFDGSERYIEISVGGTALAPRLRMLPSPYTYRAKTAEVLTDSNGLSTLTLSNDQYEMAKPLRVTGNLTTTGQVAGASGNYSGSVTAQSVNVGSHIKLFNNGEVEAKTLDIQGDVEMGNYLRLNGNQPTINFSDTDHGMYSIHNNAEKLYFLYTPTKNAVKGNQWNTSRPLTILNGSSVGIHNTSPSHALDVSGNARVTGTLFFDGTKGLLKSGGDYGTVRTTGGGNGGWEGYSIDNRYVFMSEDNDKAGLYNDIDNKWIMLYNRTDGTHGSIHLYTRKGTVDGGVVARFKHTNGSNYASYDGDGNWDYYSDRRLKENISKTKNLLDRVMKLDVKSFDFKDNDKKAYQDIGFIAQDVEPHFPSLISESEDVRYDHKVKAIGYSTFGVIATGAVKELKLEKDAEIEALKSENSELRNELVLLRKEMDDRLGALEKALNLN